MAEANCDYCGGYGYLPGNSVGQRQSCLKCNGTGKMRVPDKHPTHRGGKGKGKPAKAGGPPLWLLLVGALVLMVIFAD